MSTTAEQTLTSLFGEEIVEISKELNQSGRFTVQQAEIIESVCKEILQRSDCKDAQKDYVQSLDLKTSCLLCSWMLRGGSPVIRTHHAQGY